MLIVRFTFIISEWEKCIIKEKQLIQNCHHSNVQNMNIHTLFDLSLGMKGSKVNQTNASKSKFLLSYVLNPRLKQLNENV